MAKGYTYQKHAVAMTAVYAGLAVALAVLLKKSKADEGERYPKQLGKLGCTKVEWVAGGALATSYLLSMSASYWFIKKLFCRNKKG